MDRSLGGVVTIKSGYTLRSSVTSYSKGSVLVLQAANIIADDYTGLPSISIDNPEKHSLRDGDVLLSTKGSFRAALFESKKQPAIASSSLSILRPIPNEILPQYLVLYLNSQHGQRSLARVATGSHIKSIKKQELGNALILVPPPHVQRRLVSCAEKVTEYQDLIDKKRNLLESLLNYIVNKTLEEIK